MEQSWTAAAIFKRCAQFRSATVHNGCPVKHPFFLCDVIISNLFGMFVNPLKSLRWIEIYSLGENENAVSERISAIREETLSASSVRSSSDKMHWSFSISATSLHSFIIHNLHKPASAFLPASRFSMIYILPYAIQKINVCSDFYQKSISGVSSK